MDWLRLLSVVVGFGAVLLLPMVVACDGDSPADPADLAAREKLQTQCPVDDKPIDQQVSVEYAGRHIYFCSDPCRRRFNADNRPYIEKLPQFAPSP
jgi:YHS domain-containing protein